MGNHWDQRVWDGFWVRQSSVSIVSMFVHHRSNDWMVKHHHQSLGAKDDVKQAQNREENCFKDIINEEKKENCFLKILKTREEKEYLVSKSHKSRKERDCFLKNIENWEKKENGFKNLRNWEDKENFSMNILKIKTKKRTKKINFLERERNCWVFLFKIFRDRHSCFLKLMPL